MASDPQPPPVTAGGSVGHHISCEYVVNESGRPVNQPWTHLQHSFIQSGMASDPPNQIACYLPPPPPPPYRRPFFDDISCEESAGRANQPLQTPPVLEISRPPIMVSRRLPSTHPQREEISNLDRGPLQTPPVFEISRPPIMVCGQDRARKSGSWETIPSVQWSPSPCTPPEQWSTWQERWRDSPTPSIQGAVQGVTASQEEEQIMMENERLIIRADKAIDGEKGQQWRGERGNSGHVS